MIIKRHKHLGPFEPGGVGNIKSCKNAMDTFRTTQMTAVASVPYNALHFLWFNAGHLQRQSGRSLSDSGDKKADTYCIRICTYISNKLTKLLYKISECVQK